eukprot:1144270-Pelagomonas_calceolata.AAC.11
MHSDAHRHQHMAAVEEIDNYAGPAAAAGDDGGGLLQPLGVHGVVGRGQQGVQLGAHQLACAHAQQGRHVPSGKGDGAVRVAHLHEKNRTEVLLNGGRRSALPATIAIVLDHVCMQQRQPLCKEAALDAPVLVHKYMLQ